jgi:hypothetical protein
MTGHSHIHRVAAPLAVALASLTLAAPAAAAGAPAAWGWPHETRIDEVPAPAPVRPTTMDALTEEEILASRGQGPPETDVDGAAIVGGSTIALLTLAGAAFAARRRTRAVA